MLARRADGPFDSVAWFFEIKWDGLRCLAFVQRGRVRLQSRQLTDLSAQFPELRGLAALPEGTVPGQTVAPTAGRCCGGFGFRTRSGSSG